MEIQIIEIKSSIESNSIILGTNSVINIFNMVDMKLHND